MGSISTGIGLVSGIDTASLIDSLIALEGRGKIRLQQRIATLQSQQAAMLDINARLLSLKQAARSFRLDSIFQSALATSSDDSILSASASAKAQPGTFNFVVKQLVSNSQQLSRGFSDYDTAPLGLKSLTLGLGKGNLERDTDLADLNGGQGVRAGKIVINDRAGGQATLDLSDAVTVQEVLDRINNASGVSVVASVKDDGLVLTDKSGGSGTLSVADAAGSFTATDLGVAGSAGPGSDVLTGASVNTIGSATSLSSLNDGTGILIRSNNPDIRITARDGSIHNISFGRIHADIDGDTLLSALNGGEGITISEDHDKPDLKLVARDGTEYEVNLTGVTTVSGLISRVNAETDGHIQLSLGEGNRFVVTDTLGGEGPLKVLGTGDNGDATAKDLGIFTEGVEADEFVGEFVPSTVQKAAATTLGDIVQRINEQSGGAITAMINQSTGSLQIIDNTGGEGNLIVRGTAANQFAVRQLGIETDEAGLAAGSVQGTRLIANLGSVLTRNLNGGAGIGGEELQITDRTGAVMTVSGLDGYHSLNQIVDAINEQASAQGLTITAGLNDSGTGLQITDTSGSGASNLIITGSAAAGLGIEADSAEHSVRGSHLNARYVSEATRLEDLNYGRGIGTGSFRITDGFGKTATINVGPNQTTLYDIIQVINAQGGSGGLAVRARVNDTGDGLLIEEDLSFKDGSKPFVAMKVEAVNGNTARDLNILGTAAAIEGATIDGGYTRSIDVAENDTLADVIAKINESGVPISASVLNSGSGGQPYRVNFTSNVAGRQGELIIDAGGFDLGLSVLSRGQDAKVVVGGGGGSGGEGFLVTSRTNTLSGVIPNVTINLHAVSSESVSLEIARDEKKIADAVERFVDAFNEAVARIDHYDFFDVDEEQRGILLGNPTTSRVRTALMRAVQQQAEGVDTQYQFLREVGIRIGAGAKLEFDKDRFLEAWENDSGAVEKLFAAYESKPKGDEEIVPGVTVPGSGETVLMRGLGDIFDALLDDLTNSENGVIALAGDSFTDQIKLSQDRVKTMDQRLERRRAQLERQFVAMEVALAQLQNQSSALMSLAGNVQLATSMGKQNQF